MHKLFFCCLVALLPVFKCYTPQTVHPKPDTGKTFTTTHFNILFVPDLSNRVDPDRYKRPLNDVDILSIITSNLYPAILRFKRSEYQKDKLTIDFINKGLISQYKVNTDNLLIDFGRFANQLDRIHYITGNNGVSQTLSKDIYDMTTEFTRMNGLAVKQNVGADIWSYFHQGIDEKRVLAAENPIKYGNNSYVNTYRNLLILLTDGYIEAGIFNQGFDLSKNTINRFRKAFLKSGENNMQQFLEKNKQFQIKPVDNEYLKNLEVLVMETYDRSLSKDGAATVHPTDMEIIKLCWTYWLQQSNIKRFELHPYAASKDEAEKTILNFIGITKVK
ncbi:hypothetical protein [Chitinophaga nivalis]|uniref:Uncharacterized protein n=1 Tax=Chitinophaga nivalis TaxID=2991709 RepID=A0ABT3IT15_9BACT|nr:hypothetical protein [Chitinophaga nivalis]MCW3463461.1 hypothetical protein [Chitinophaga nivalis]MCW3486849.1 hypothetical protein [Chitinophaga nivalis]